MRVTKVTSALALVQVIVMAIAIRYLFDATWLGAFAVVLAGCFLWFAISFVRELLRPTE